MSGEKRMRVRGIGKIKNAADEWEERHLIDVCGDCINWSGRLDGFCVCERGPYYAAV